MQIEKEKLLRSRFDDVVGMKEGKLNVLDLIKVLKEKR